MARVVDTARETGSGENARPAVADIPSDLQSRADVVRGILAASSCPLDRHPLHAFWAKMMRRTATATVVAVAAGIVWTGPKLTPAEAARVLAQSPGLANVANYPMFPDGPRVVIISSTPGALGPLNFPPSSPPRRLDGTLLDLPPTVYGLPPYRVGHLRK
jgi:hypothetical protein